MAGHNYPYLYNETTTGEDFLFTYNNKKVREFLKNRINKDRKYQTWSNLFKRFLKIEIGYEGRFSKG